MKGFFRNMPAVSRKNASGHKPEHTEAITLYAAIHPLKRAVKATRAIIGNARLG